MPHSVWAILAAVVAAYSFTGIAKIGAFKPKDNNETRTWQAKLTGWRQRAYWAHQNSLEGFPLFAAAVLAAMILAPQSTTAPLLAWGYVATRIGYGYCYIKDFASARSLVWGLGLACIVALYVIAGLAAS